MSSADSTSVSTGVAIDEREASARLAPAIRLFAMRRLRTGPEVDDFVQEALLALVEAIRGARIAEPSGVGPYAIGICRNLLREGARTRGRRDGLLQRFGADLAPDVGLYASSDAGFVGFERVRMDDCVSRLTTNARTVLKRAIVLDETNEEIAAALGLGEGNVRVIRHRTLKFLRECVEQSVSWEAFR